MAARAIYRCRADGRLWFDRELVEFDNAPPMAACDLVMVCDLEGRDLSAADIEAAFVQAEPSAEVMLGSGWAALFRVAPLPGARRYVAVVPGTNR